MIAFGARHRHILVHGQILRSFQRDFLVALEELGLIRGGADWIFSVMILPFHDIRDLILTKILPCSTHSHSVFSSEEYQYPKFCLYNLPN